MDHNLTDVALTNWLGDHKVAYTTHNWALKSIPNNSSLKFRFSKKAKNVMKSPVCLKNSNQFKNFFRLLRKHELYGNPIFGQKHKVSKQSQLFVSFTFFAKKSDSHKKPVIWYGF